MKYFWHWRSCAVLLISVCLLSGCITRQEEQQKIRDLEFTVLDKEDVPPELKEMIKEKEEETFRLTYSDQGNLYIAEGYGEQPTTGYSVEVDALYETEDTVRIHTRLMGPAYGEEIKEIATYPYVAVQLKELNKEVLFE